MIEVSNMIQSIRETSLAKMTKYWQNKEKYILQTQQKNTFKNKHLKNKYKIANFYFECISPLSHQL